MKLLITTALATALMATGAIAEDASRGAGNAASEEVAGATKHADAVTESMIYDAEGNEYAIQYDESGNATSEDMLDRSRGAGNETSSETAGVDNQQEWYDSEGNTVGVMWDDEGMMTFEANEGEYADNAGSYRSRGAGDTTSAEVSGDDNMQEAD